MRKIRVTVLVVLLIASFANAFCQDAPVYKYYKTGKKDVSMPVVARFRLSLGQPSQTLSGWNNLVGDPAFTVPVVEDPISHIGLKSTGTTNWNKSFGNHNANDGAGAFVDDGNGFKFPPEVIKNYWYNYLDYTSSGKKQLQFYNLNPSYPYKITIVGSVDISTVLPPLFSEYGALGQSSLAAKSLDIYKNTSKYVELILRPDANGTIYLSMNRDISGTKGSFGVINAITIEQTSYKIPTAPLSLRADGGNSIVNLTWSAPVSDGGIDIVSYRIYRGTTSGNTTLQKEIAGTLLNYADNNLTNETTYYYAVSAVNERGESVKSAEIQAVPSSLDRKSYWYPISGWDPQNPDQQAMIYEPAGYRDGNANTYPVILSLHGNEGYGTDINKIKTAGLPSQINNGQNMQCLVIAPQVKSGTAWINTSRPGSAINYIKSHYRCDLTRFYVTGLSSGGMGTWWQMRSNDTTFAAAIVVSGNGSSGGTASDNKARSYPAMFVGGDDDATVPFFISGQTGTMTWLTSWLNTGVSKPVIPIQVATVKGGQHMPTVWNDRVYDKSKAFFDFEKWLLNFSRDPVYTATKHVEMLESYANAGNYDDALFTLDNTLVYINKVSNSGTKQILLDRYNAVKNAIDARGKRYLIKFGAAMTGTKINSQASGLAGAHTDHLVDMVNGSVSTINFEIVQQADNDAAEYAFSPTNPNVFSHKYLGFDADFLKNSFRVFGSGGLYRFTGLDNMKQYRVLFFGAVDSLDHAHPAELTVVNGSIAKYIFEPFNTQDYIEFSNLSPANGVINFEIKGSPVVTNMGIVTRPHNATLQTDVSNISGYGGWNGYVCGAMIIEMANISP